MGNGSLKGGMHVQLETPTYKEGEEVSGVIYMRLDEYSPSGTIYIKFKGSEKTRWQETRTRTVSDGKTTRTETYQVHYSGSKKIVKFKFPAYTFNGEIQTGGFTLPFSFVLPGNLPGSFYYDKGSTHAKIHYKIKATFENIEKKKIKNHAEIRIIQEPKFTDDVGSRLQTTAKLRTCCCINKGYISLKADFAKGSYTPDETAFAKVQADNSNSKLSVSRFEMNLVQTLRLRSDCGHSKVIRDNVLNTRTNDGVPSGEAMLAEQSKELQLYLPMAKPQIDFRYTTMGRFVECVYFLEVKADMEGICMCCGDTPSIESPLGIHATKPPAPPLPQAPEGWNPQEIPAVAIRYDPSYDYAPSAPEYEGA